MPLARFLLCKRKKICYNTIMQKEQKDNSFYTLIGKPTPAKASGLAFSLAAVLPTLIFAVFLLLMQAFGLVGENYEQADWYLYASYFIPQISFGVIAWLCLRYRKTPLKRAVQAQKCPAKYFLVAFVLQIGLLSLSELNALFLEWHKNFGYTDAGITLPSTAGFGFVGVLFAIAVLPALFEEILFRGILLDGLKESFNERAAVLICGFLFALYHQNPAQTIYQFCCGAAFALVAIRAGSVLPTVLSHFLNNAFILILYACKVEQIPTPIFVPYVTISALCLIGSLGYLLFLNKPQKREKTGSGKEFWLFAAVGVLLCTLTWVAVFVSGL